MPSNPMSGAAAIDSIGPTEAKVTPIMTGRRMPTPGEAEALHQRRQPAGEQIRADQEGDVFRRQLQRAADDQGNGDRAGVHHQHMLQAERQQPRNRQD